MCCFSGNIGFVRNTRIFARAEDRIRQFLVYQMAFDAQKDLAMILPLPVRPASDENAVRFIDLQGYPAFFQDLNSGFPVPRSFGFGCSASAPAAPAAPVLKVQSVGSFEASFVPTVADFSRLDKRFRLEDDVWKKLPAYESFGFAVFKLKSGNHETHPMAFSFPRRQLGSLFFPTVHIHDGEVHEKAEFDHSLYCQPFTTTKKGLLNWAESESLAKSFMDLSKSAGLIDGTQHCYRLPMQGKLANTDTFVHNV